MLCRVQLPLVLFGQGRGERSPKIDAAQARQGDVSLTPRLPGVETPIRLYARVRCDPFVTVSRQFAPLASHEALAMSVASTGAWATSLTRAGAAASSESVQWTAAAQLRSG